MLHLQTTRYLPGDPWAGRHRSPGVARRVAREIETRFRGVAVYLGRAAHETPRTLTRKVRQLWDGIPGPWPVKALLVAVAVAEPGPWGEIALAAFATWNAARKARKAKTVTRTP